MFKQYFSSGVKDWWRKALLIHFDVHPLTFSLSKAVYKTLSIFFDDIIDYIKHKRITKFIRTPLLQLLIVLLLKKIQKSLLSTNKTQIFGILQYIFQKIHNGDLGLRHRFCTTYNASLIMFCILSKINSIFSHFFHISFQLLWISFLLLDLRLKLRNMTNLSKI